MPFFIRNSDGASVGLTVAFALYLVLALSSSRAELPVQPIIDSPLPPREAAATMKVPTGFSVTLFAGEPDVQQPISFCIDDRGRIWVAEAYNYPHHGTTPGDRILILEDTDGDGEHDKRTVFFDGLNYVTGIEVGFGGAWVMSPPNFYFIPDADGDDRPDSAPKILLDGFGNHANSHNLANGFAWGPDGWLYGTHGRTNWSLLGKPGTPNKDRVRFDGGVYRYHPVRHVWEPYADGTTNPWGIDWNEVGQAFVCNCVNPHLFHVIPGAHYEPWRNRESSRYAYERIPTIADHLHFLGGADGVRTGLLSDEEDLLGGGHAHCGTMVYLGDNWPDRYRNSVFMNNIHGRRINHDVLRRHGSGYVASHAADVMVARDPWYMGVTLQYGPDGAVFASDWSDTGECHSVRNTRRGTGRIYKIAYGKVSYRSTDVASLSDRRLVELQANKNAWHARHARRVLQERAAKGSDLGTARQALLAMFADAQSSPPRLRALWSLHVIGGIDEGFLVRQLSNTDENVRWWAIQLLIEGRSPEPEALRRFKELAGTDDSPLVRLSLASALQRLPYAARWPIATALAGHAEDAGDANLPLMIWYGVEPLVDESPRRFAELVGQSRMPLLRRHVARRIAERGDGEPLNALVNALLGVQDRASQLDVLEGMLVGFTGQRSVRMPNSWPRAYSTLRAAKNPELTRKALDVALVFDDPVALEWLTGEALNTTARGESRRLAIRALAAKRANGAAELLIGLLDDSETQATALRELAEFDREDIAAEILRRYDGFANPERSAAIQTLVSRSDWADQLLDAVAAQRIPASEITAFAARQLRNLGDPTIVNRVREIWGELRPTDRDKARVIARHRRRLRPERLKFADLSSGRRIFERTCAKCHKLFGQGGTVGPDITGSQRTNIDYILENLVDPNAAVSRDFQMEVIETTAGRVVTGLVIAENTNAITIHTATDPIVIPKNEIESRSRSTQSMMPEGLLKDMSDSDILDLVGYLAAPQQVPRGSD